MVVLWLYAFDADCCAFVKALVCGQGISTKWLTPFLTHILSFIPSPFLSFSPFLRNHIQLGN